MKKFVLIAFAAAILPVMVCATEIDAGLSSGTSVYVDVAGVDGGASFRYLLPPIAARFVPTVDGRLLYSYASVGSHTEHEVALLAGAGMDFNLLPSISFSVSGLVGGGYLSDSMYKSSRIGMCGFYASPVAAVSWRIDLFSLALEAGQRFAVFEKAAKNCSFVAVSLRYRIRHDLHDEKSGSADPGKRGDR